MASALLVLILLLPTTLACGKLESESKAWRDQVEETVVELQKSVDTVALAVPGERWNRQMVKLTDTDPKVRQNALDDLAAGSGLSLAENFRVRALLIAEKQEGIRGRFFLASSNDESELRGYCSNSSLPSFDTRAVETSRAATNKELHDAARARADKVLRTIFGSPRLGPLAGYAGRGVKAQQIYWDRSPDYDFGERVIRETNSHVVTQESADAVALEARYQDAVSALADLVSLHYERTKTNNDGGAYDVPWKRALGAGYLHVAIPEGDHQRLLRVDAWIHEVGNPDNRMDDMEIQKLPASKFTLVSDEVKQACSQEEDFYWGVLNLADVVYHPRVTQELVVQLQSMKSAVDDLLAIRAGEPSSSDQDSDDTEEQ